MSIDRHDRKRLRDSHVLALTLTSLTEYWLSNSSRRSLSVLLSISSSSGKLMCTTLIPD